MFYFHLHNKKNILKNIIYPLMEPREAKKNETKNSLRQKL